MLVRLHPRARKTLFVPNGTQGRPVPVEGLASRRVTEWNLRLEPSGLSPTIGERLMIHAQGLALSTVEPCSLILKPTGRCLWMKTSTLPQPQSLSESKEATETERRKHVDSSSRPSRPLSVEDTLVAKLDKAREVTLEDFKALVLQAVSDMGPTTSQRYVHDHWLDFPASYVRVHHKKHIELCMPHLRIKVWPLMTLRRHT